MFNFINNDVKDKLEPLYLDSKTWREFIDRLVQKYDEIKYKLIYDWYRSAIYTIFDGIEINQDWKIDISKRQNILCMPTLQKGGKTRKYNKLEPFYWSL